MGDVEPGGQSTGRVAAIGAGRAGEDRLRGVVSERRDCGAAGGDMPRALAEDKYGSTGTIRAAIYYEKPQVFDALCHELQTNLDRGILP